MKKNIIRVVCIIVFIYCYLSLVQRDKQLVIEEQTYAELRQDINENSNLTTRNKSSVPVEEEVKNFGEIKIEEKEILSKFIDSEFLDNKDFIGWIKTNDIIDYPIMQCLEDSNFYLHRDFYGNESSSGSIYIPNDITLDDKLVMIYGHHMKNDSMFGSLDYYLDEDYFNRNKIIYLDTLYEERVYEVVCLFEGQVYDNLYTGFKYYDYRGNITNLEFNEYKNGIESNILIGNTDNISYEDDLIELITCWYSKDNARLVLLAKRV